MKDETFRRLTGVVEMDETYVGGSAFNAHRGNRGKKTKAVPGARDHLVPPKTAVIGAIARKGNVVCQMIERTDHAIMGLIGTTNALVYGNQVISSATYGVDPRRMKQVA